MADRMELLTPRTVGDKTYFTKIGVAFPTKTGGWSLSFEALPLPQIREGKLETRVLMMAPKDNAPARGKAPPADFSDLNNSDDIPF